MRRKKRKWEAPFRKIFSLFKNASAKLRGIILCFFPTHRKKTLPREMGSWNMRNGLPKHEKWVPESREMGSWKTRNGFPKHDKWVPETREMGSWNTRNGFPKHGREMGSRNTRNGFQKHTPGELGSQNILHARKWFRKHIPGVMGSRNTRNRFPKIFKFNRIWFHSFLGPRQSTPLISKFSDFCIMVMVIFVLKMAPIFD